MKRVKEWMTRKDIADIKHIIGMLQADTEWIKQASETKESSDKKKDLDLAIKFVQLRRTRIQNTRQLIWILLTLTTLLSMAIRLF